jgi:hypothetical protein
MRPLCLHAGDKDEGAPQIQLRFLQPLCRCRSRRDGLRFRLKTEPKVYVGPIGWTGPLEERGVCKICELRAPDRATNRRHGVRQPHGAMDISSPQDDLGLACGSRRRDIVVQSKLAYPIGLVHASD